MQKPHQFHVKARVLLELGAELISSDEVALYELIKNAVDAKSEKIIIRVQSLLRHSDYLELQREARSISGQLTTAQITKWIQLYFSPQTPEEFKLETIGALSGQDRNSAPQILRDIYSKSSFIAVEDFGDGMTAEELDQNFLTIGTPNRLKDGKKYLGEKGIGRLSTMRLGRRLVVTTTTLQDGVDTQLRCDWGVLEESLGLDLEDFHPEILPLKEPKSKPKGTSLLIADLQGDWSELKLRQIAKSHLSKLQDPFDRTMERLDLRLIFNGEELKDVFLELDQDWLKEWHGYLEMKFSYKETTVNRQQIMVPVLQGKAIYRVPMPGGKFEEDEKIIFGEGEGVYSLLADEDVPMQPGQVKSNASRYLGIETLGAFTMEGYWYNRQRKGIELKDNKDKKNDFKDWLEQWGGGLLVYRDGYRVYPYASPEDDWLSLDQKALRRRSYKLNRGQFVGYVRLSSSENKALKDQTNREGMRDSPEKRALIQCLQHGIWKELGGIVAAHEERATKVAINSIQKIDQTVKEKSKAAKTALTSLSRVLPDSDTTIRTLRSHIDQLELAWSHAKTTIKKQQENVETYVHLAGVGLLVEFLVHELARTAKYTLNDLDKQAKGTPLTPALRSLQQQLKTLEKRIRILDPVSIPGRQTKSECDVLEVISTLLSAHQSQFERHRISIEFDPKVGDHLFARVVPGQVFQIFENLISNSVYWLSTRASLTEWCDLDPPYQPTITIQYDAAAKKVDFLDNGPGIEEMDADKIYDPFWSKKPASAGRGLGLFITKRLCEDNEIKIDLIWDDDQQIYSGFRFAFS